MKTGSLKKEIRLTTNLVSATDLIVIETATDVFSMSFYRKSWFGFGKKWKRKYRLWGFSGSAKDMMKFLNEWLEVYK